MMFMSPKTFFFQVYLIGLLAIPLKLDYAVLKSILFDARIFTRSPPFENTRPTAITLHDSESSKNEGLNVDTAVQTILNRPLFSLDRRQYKKPPPPKSILPRLSGTIIIDNYRIAILQSGSQKPLTVAEGATFGDFSVASVAAGNVVLSSPEDTQVLHLARSSEALVQTAGTQSPVFFRLPTPNPIAVSLPYKKWGSSQDLATALSIMRNRFQIPSRPH